MKIAQAFHPLFSFFEVILRNQLHYVLNVDDTPISTFFWRLKTFSMYLTIYGHLSESKFNILII